MAVMIYYPCFEINLKSKIMGGKEFELLLFINKTMINIFPLY